ncbi:hypothetical protein N7466_005975 [Penicillium verhagenii]|uniref:uncharacterized protein n=1 Tax=Penicillium verhagenii TaxID=1562060 RepID=UPI0025453119|nr:uncharacterized protein N7466_005975 [Penicillium verhagenii]KAJ5930482.1 hypothetical protein N7466_005975 [Penicillium verhagenii]
MAKEKKKNSRSGTAHRTIQGDQQYRLDRQCVTSMKPRYHNPQVQDRATDTISVACVPVKDPWDAGKIEEELKANIDLKGYRSVPAELKPVAVGA